MGWWTSSGSTFNFDPIRYTKEKEPIPMPALVKMLGEPELNERSYIQAPLLCPLIAGETYEIDLTYTFKDLQFESLGIYFSDSFIHIPKKKVYQIDTFTGSFRVHQMDSLLPFEASVTARLEGSRLASGKRSLKISYTASGSEKFILIGNFNTDEETARSKRLFQKKRMDGSFLAIHHIDLVSSGGKSCDCEKQVDILETLNRRHSFLGACDDSAEVDMNQLFANIPAWIKEETPALEEGNYPLEIGRPYTIDLIYFAFDSAVLENRSFASLDSLAEILLFYDAFAIHIIGHTDSLGKDDYNLALSYHRAEAVRQYLISKGIFSPEKLKAFGRGSTEPIAPNNSEQGRQMNRRVEFILMEAEAETR